MKSSWAARVTLSAFAANSRDLVIVIRERSPLRVVRAGEAELAAHAARLAAIDKSSGGSCLWLKEDTEPVTAAGG